jgi:hypothetical protein
MSLINSKRDLINLFFKNYIRFITDSDTEDMNIKVVKFLESLGVDSCQIVDKAAEVLRWIWEAHQIKKDYKIVTNGLRYKIQKRYFSWGGIEKWKDIKDMTRPNILTEAEGYIHEIIKERLAEKFGWRDIYKECDE